MWVGLKYIGVKQVYIWLRWVYLRKLLEALGSLGLVEERKKKKRL